MGNRMGALKHGMYNTKLYQRWSAMLQRTLNPKSKSFYNYGGRGIGVCTEWVNFISFMEWATNNGYDEKLNFDRIDNSGDYSPENCRWTDRSTNQINRRKKELYNIYPARKRWCVQVHRPEKYYYVGLFKTIEEAVIARDNFIETHDKK